ncbi:hypothetical protein, partial [Rhodococcus jostii]|uniref:hypothetical protein n=1 Tax=Rhodococcus jostii TaxID=132919 RepID=UPI00363685E9
SLTTLPPTIAVSADTPTPVVTVTGSGTVDAVVAAVSAQAGTPTLTAAGRVTALVATASASANTPVIGGGATITAVTATGTAAGRAPIVSGGMNPQGMQRTTAALQLTSASTYQKLTPMQAKSGYESTIVSDGLVVPGSATVNLAARLEFNSASASDRRVRIVKNGSTVLGESTSSGTHSSLTLSVNGVTLVASDSLTLEGYGSGTASTRNISESTGVTYLTVTVP